MTQGGPILCDHAVAALIPAYNAAGTVGEVVQRALRHVGTCLVVNDGSADDTAVHARAAGALLIDHEHNKGKGAALRTGLAYVRARPFEFVVLLDADGQHDPDEIPRMVAGARAQGADMICGTRMTNPQGMPWLRRVTNRTMSAFLSWLCRVRLTDTQCGYRLLSARAVQVVELRKDRFEVESEMLIQAVTHRLVLGEVSVRSIYGDDHASHIKPLRDSVRFISLVWHLALRRFLASSAQPCDTTTRQENQARTTPLTRNNLQIGER
jgi:glycosyltransferase involved in cell wall biosynthesis